MNCPACSRPLAPGARKCVYCGQGTQFRPPQKLNIPAGTLPARKKAFPWGRLFLFLIIAAAVAAAFLHPELNAKIRGILGSFF